MILYNNKYDFELWLEENKINHLVIENEECFSNVLQTLYDEINGLDGHFFLTEGDKNLKIEKEVNIIYNPFIIDCNDKKIITKIYKELDEQIQVKYISEFAELNGRILNLIDQVLDSSDYSLSSDSCFNIQGLFKLYNIKVSTSTESLFDKIIDYVRISSEVLSNRVFIFVNINHFLREEELQGLYEFFVYRKLHMINISGNDYAIPDSHSKIIIDNSLCIITI